MKFISQTTTLAAVTILSFALAGCGREEVKVQRVPKDEAAPQMAQTDMQPQAGSLAVNATMPMDSMHSGLGMGGGAVSRTKLKWTLPAGWEEKPAGEYRVASFSVKGKEGQADVSIIPLPSTGREVDLVNMWRQQMHLPAVAKEAADKEAEVAAIGSEQGKLFDIGSEDAIMDGAKARMTVAMLERNGTSWFFKMTGEDAFVHSQKAVFLGFLKSISFDAAPAMAAVDPHAGMTVETAQPTAAGNSDTSLPAGWKEVPPTQFLVAKYVVQGNSGEASVNVSMLQGTGGGLLPNVNRWRGQLGLSPTSEAELAQQSQSIDLASGKATVVDMTGTDARTGKKARLVGIVAPQASDTWFYKLMGDEQVVEQQKDAFTKFVQSAKYSNAP